MYLARVAALRGGVPVETAALTLNRLCGSGLQAILTAADAIVHGDTDAAIGGGAESMSRAPYWLPSMRWGARLNDATAVDVLVAAVTDPFDEVHMGITAENVARKWGISRHDQDELAVESHRRAMSAIESGKFKAQIVPIELKSKNGPVMFMTDEQPRSDATLENLARLKPAFDPEGTVTAGNASSINDGAAAVVLMERSAAEERGLKPMAVLVDYVVTGVEPKVMGIGPISAVRKLFAAHRPAAQSKWMSSNSTKPSQRSCSQCGANLTSLPTRPIRMAAGFRSAIRSAQPAPLSPSRPCTNWAVSTENTRWSPCASVADKASPPFSNR